MKIKKQFRLYDIYRYATLGIMSNISGISNYECNNNATTIVVKFKDYSGKYPNGLARVYSAENEEDLKQIIKEVNKRLGNCMKPGRVKRVKGGK